MYTKIIDSFEKGVSLAKISEYCEAKLIGDPNCLVKNLCTLEKPLSGAITFSKKNNLTKQLESLQTANISAIFVGPEQVPQAGLNLLVAPDPHRAFIKAIDLFYKKALDVFFGIAIHETVKISSSARISPGVRIAANSVIEDNVVIMPNAVIYHGVRIGAGTIVHANVTIREYVEIGKNVIIHPGSVIGADGFGYLPDPKLGIIAVPQIGNVVIKDFVEIGANTCIDRAAIGSTFIGQGTKIDNQVQIGHNVEIGQYSIICGQVGIAGSVKIGNQVVMGGSSKVADHLSICDKVRLGGGAVVLSSIDEPGDYAGLPATEAGLWRRNQVTIKKISQIVKDLKK